MDLFVRKTAMRTVLKMPVSEITGAACMVAQLASPEIRARKKRPLPQDKQISKRAATVGLLSDLVLFLL